MCTAQSANGIDVKSQPANGDGAPRHGAPSTTISKAQVNAARGGLVRKGVTNIENVLHLVRAGAMLCVCVLM